jgi:hypothetical protein
MQGMSCLFFYSCKSVSSQTSHAGHSLGPPALLLLEGRGTAHPATLGCSGFNLARSGAVA